MNTSEDSTVEQARNRWWYLHDSQQLGPVTLQQLRDLLASGFLTPETLIAQESAEKWVPMLEVLSQLEFQSHPKPKYWRRKSCWIVALCLVALFFVGVLVLHYLPQRKVVTAQSEGTNNGLEHSMEHQLASAYLQ